MLNVPWQNIILMETPHVIEFSMDKFSVDDARSSNYLQVLRKSFCDTFIGKLLHESAGVGKLCHLNIFSVKSLT